jgi:hypothetical protein
MRKFCLLLLAVLAWAGIAVAAGVGDFFAGDDIHLTAYKMVSHSDPDADEQVVVFDEDFSLEFGGNVLTSDRAIVWITAKSYQYRGAESVDYSVRAYLDGGVKVSQRWSGKAKKDDSIIEQGKSLVVHFFVTGEVFATASESVDAGIAELKNVDISEKALKATRPIRPMLRVAADAVVPRYKDNITVIDEKFGKRPKNILRASDYFAITEVEQGQGPAVAVGFAPEADTITADDAAAGGVEESEYQYPINISGLWEQEPEIRITELDDGSKVATLLGRFYLWQKKNERGDIIEFQADSGVIFYGGDDFAKSDGTTVAKGSVDAVYFSGNIVMTEGERTIRSEEMFYDFVNKRALAVKAEMRKFDNSRGIPVYLRAAKLQQVAENVFQADNIVLTTSEFYLPQISLTASQLVMTDLQGVEDRSSAISEDSKFDAVISGVEMKAGKKTFFMWPRIRTDFERPDLPIRRVNVGHDSDFGTFVETRWYLSRLLGLKEPEGVDSSLMLDYFGDRGSGIGAVIDYSRNDYYGGVSGYIINDRGQDDLGRTRKNLEPDAATRGRFTSRHRHYLPYDWQATLETSYISDKHFLESYFRTEFNTSKAQETLLHLKRIKDYWAFSLLNKVRINDFQSEVEELPTVEVHLKGVSFWDNRMTYYGDTQVSRLRSRIPAGSDPADFDQADSGQFFTFFTSRHEVDVPMRWGSINIVPFAAGSFSIDDGDGFTRNIDDSVSTTPESDVLLGEAGVRVSTLFWKEDGSFKSELWDVDGIRHIIKPLVDVVG